MVTNVVPDVVADVVTHQPSVLVRQEVAVEDELAAKGARRGVGLLKGGRRPRIVALLDHDVAEGWNHHGVTPDSG